MPQILLVLLRRTLFWTPILLGGGLVLRSLVLAQGIERWVPWPDEQAGRTIQHFAGGLAMAAAGIVYQFTHGFQAAPPSSRLIRAGLAGLGSLVIVSAVLQQSSYGFLAGAVLLALPLVLHFWDASDEDDVPDGTAEAD